MAFRNAGGFRNIDRPSTSVLPFYIFKNVCLARLVVLKKVLYRRAQRCGQVPAGGFESGAAQLPGLAWERAGTQADLGTCTAL